MSSYQWEDILDHNDKRTHAAVESHNMSNIYTREEKWLTIMAVSTTENEHLDIT